VSRKPLRLWLSIAAAISFGVGGIAVWRESGAGDAPASGHPAAGGRVAALPGGPPEPGEEFIQAAEKLFRTPGGLMDRTRSGFLRRLLAQPGTGGQNPIGIRYELVKELLREDKTDAAIAEIESLFHTLASRPELFTAEPRLHLTRALAYLRKAEIENCVRRHNGDCCIFPLAEGGVHAVKSPAAQAAQSYLDYLRVRPDDLAARWLLNLSHMAIGTYPESVPPEFLIPIAAPNSASDFPRFANVARECGITRRNHAGGSVAEDFDGDGLLDIVLSSCNPEAPLVYYRNTGTGIFEDRTVAAGLLEQLGGLNLVATDPDDDGDIDLFVLRGGWLGREGEIRNSLLLNDGRGNFTDVTYATGLALPKRPTQVGVWFDYDNDGDLDVFVGNESRHELAKAPGEPPGSGEYPCQLFRNEGNGTFTDVAEAAGVRNDRMCKGATAGDYDGDGWSDLYVSNLGRNRLYRNNGDGTFTDVAERLGVQEPTDRSFATWFFDYDDDGNLDLFVCAYDVRTEDLPAWILGRQFASAPPRLYRNRGDGTFEDVTRTAGLWRPIQPMGANFGDLDNDGHLDVYLATGNPDYEALLPNVMLRNTGDGRFVDVTVAGGFGSLQKGHGIAFADFDHDGDQDVLNQVGGFYQGDSFYNSLYENPGNENRHLTLRLVGVRSNRLAYGARITVVLATPSGPRSIHRAVGSVSSFGGSPSRQEIGLGDATSIEKVQVWWPASGVRQEFTGLELDSSYEVTEGVDAPRKIAVRRLHLGGGS